MADFQFLVWHARKLVSGHPTLTRNKSKAKLTEKSTTLLRAIREVKSQGKPLPPSLERQAGTENHSLLGTKAQPWGKYHWKMSTLIDKLLEVQCGQA